MNPILPHVTGANKAFILRLPELYRHETSVALALAEQAYGGDHSKARQLALCPSSCATPCLLGLAKFRNEVGGGQNL